MITVEQEQIENGIEVLEHAREHILNRIKVQTENTPALVSQADIDAWELVHKLWLERMFEFDS